MNQKNKHILALNVGSTSIKSRVFTFSEKGEREIFNWSKGNLDPQKGHSQALSELKEALKSAGIYTGIIAVGHRVVHGGPLTKSVKAGSRETQIIKKYSELAPLHNPYNLKGIAEAKKWFRKNVPQVAVFDTAFYAGLPDYAWTYPIAAKYTRKYGLRRYGFHGISHNYSMLEASRLLKKPVNKLKLVTVHLGGGASITAIDKGRAVDTSMGFTPLEGLVMGTRSGDIDPGIIFYLADKAKLSLKQLKNLLVNESGIYGLCGVKNMLDLLKKIKRKDKKALLAFKIYAYHIQKYIGAYAAILGKCDAVVFTGAIGAGKSYIRGQIVQSLKKHALKGVSILAIKPNEEKMIAREVYNLPKL